MLENVRYKIANHFAMKELDQIESGEIMRGLKNFKRSIRVVPPSKELSDFEARMRQTVTEHSKKLGV